MKRHEARCYSKKDVDSINRIGYRLRMKAWVIEKHGGPEVLVHKEIPTPTPAPGEVRVKVEALSLNHMDLWVRQGVPGHHFPLPLIPGCDITGVIDQFGPGSEEQLKPIGVLLHSPVLINPILSCGMCSACSNGNDATCTQFGLLGETQNGGCAEFVVVPARNIVLRPKNLSAGDAACIPVTFVTAWSMLFRKARVLPGELVLIHAGGSGVSVAAIQMAKLLGAVVITTVGHENKISKAKALGADFVIDYKKTSFREEVKKIAATFGKKGVDVILDHIGGENFMESLKCLAWGGRLVSCGATSDSKIQMDLKPLFFKNISILGTTMGGRGDLLRVLELFSQKKLKAVVDSTFEIAQYPKAVEKLDSRQFFGKIVLTAC